MVFKNEGFNVFNEGFFCLFYLLVIDNTINFGIGGAHPTCKVSIFASQEHAVYLRLSPDGTEVAVGLVSNWTWVFYDYATGKKKSKKAPVPTKEEEGKGIKIRNFAYLNSADGVLVTSHANDAYTNGYFKLQTPQADGSYTGVLLAGSSSAVGCAEGDGGDARFMQPAQMSSNPDGTKIVVANKKCNNVAVITIADGKVEIIAGSKSGQSGNSDGVGNLASFIYVKYVVWSSDGKKIYVEQIKSGALRVIDVATRKVTTVYKSSKFRPGQIAVSYDGSHVLVSELERNRICAMNTATPKHGVASESYLAWGIPPHVNGVAWDQYDATKMLYVLDAGVESKVNVNMLS